MRMSLIAVALISCAYPVLSHAESAEDFSFSSTNVTSFSYGDKIQRVWASLRNNPSTPAQWQFGYDPLFLPETDAQGSLVIKETELPDHSVRLQFAIDLDDAKARKLAYDQVVSAYPDQSDKIQPQNVFAIKVNAISVGIPELQTRRLDATIENPTTNFFSNTNAFSIVITCKNKDVADSVKTLLPAMRIDYSVSFSAKASKQNSVVVNYSDLRKSGLYATLNGLGTTEAYVHRDDLRSLTEDINRVMSIDGVIEDPSLFDQAIAERILNQLTSSISASVTSFDGQKWSATYNSDDLKPDVLQKTLNKDFVWDEGSKSFKFGGSAETGGKVGLLDIISAEGKASGSYTQDELQTWLKKHDVEVSFEGNKIVPKAVLLRKFNVSDFNASSQFSSVMTLVSNQVRDEKGNIDLQILLGGGDTGASLPVKVADLQSSVDKVWGELKKGNDDAVAIKARLDGKNVLVSTQDVIVPPSRPARGTIACAQTVGRTATAISAGMYLDEPDERNASFLRWYTWPLDTATWGYFMINAAGTGMGHPPGHFKVYIACLNDTH